MKFDLKKLLRPNIRGIKPYSSARDEYTGSEGIFLDANENAIGSVGTSARNRYPDPHQRNLKNELAKIKNLRPEQIFLGNGSDEAIDLIFRAFCVPGKDRVVIMPPTYGMYKVCADINDIDVIEVPLLDGFRVAINAILSIKDENVKMLFICSPNNPSGNCFDDSDIEKLVSGFKGIVVIDEAYIDFAENNSWIQRLDQFPNLIVLQTFSKAWGLANIRLGIAYASAEINDVLAKIKPPYNVNGITQETGLKALENINQYNAMVENLKNERLRLKNALRDFSFVEMIYPSDANFLLVKTNAPKEIYNFLTKQNIIVRDRSTQHLCEGCLRITVGNKDENNRLIEALRQFQNL